jgi:integrase
MKNVSIFKRSSSPSYFVQYTDHDGTRKCISTRCTLKADAIRFLTNLKATPKEPETKSRSYSAFISDFLSYAKTQYQPGTVEIYQLAFSSFQRTVGTILMDSITVRQVDAWKTSMLSHRLPNGKAYSPTYINILFRSLKAAFNTAVRWQAMKVNPFLSCKSVPASGIKPASMTVADIERLIAGMPHGTLRDFVIFAINTGARRGEILSLRWDAVDIERRFIVIRSTDTFKTKTGRDRTIPLTDGALSVLNRRHGLASGNYVFHIRGRPVNGNTITHRFKAAARAAGLPESMHVHSLRHSCASLLMQSGASITAVKELLGHSTIATTQIYTHNTTESLRRAIEKIPTLRL